MIRKLIIYGLLILAFVIIINLIGPFKGTTQSDFRDEFQPVDFNPLPSCPDSQNCVRLSVPLDIDSDELMDACEKFLSEMSAEEIKSDSQSLQIDAVFRIAFVGFQDDFSVRISEKDTGESVLHLLSRSRVGKSDLGVNRRRVQKFLSLVQPVN